MCWKFAAAAQFQPTAETLLGLADVLLQVELSYKRFPIRFVAAACAQKYRMQVGDLFVADLCGVIIQSRQEILQVQQHDQFNHS